MRQHGLQERAQDQRKHFKVVRERYSYWHSLVWKDRTQDPNRIIKMLQKSRVVFHLRLLIGYLKQILAPNWLTQRYIGSDEAHLSANMHPVRHPSEPLACLNQHFGPL